MCKYGMVRRTRWMPFRIRVDPPSGAIGLGMSSVSGPMRVPRPAAMISACRNLFTDFLLRRVVDQEPDFLVAQALRVGGGEADGNRLAHFLVEADQVMRNVAKIDFLGVRQF